MSFKIEYECEDCQGKFYSRTEPTKCPNDNCPSNKPKFEYPLYKRSNKAEMIFRFDSLQSNQIVWGGHIGDTYGIGHRTNAATPHTDNDAWEDVAYNKELDLFDAQPVVHWDIVDTAYREIRLYDAVNNKLFSYDGKRARLSYDNMIPYPLDSNGEYPQFILDMHKKLKL